MATPLAPAAMITCPSCAAETPLPSGERLLQCGYCGTSLFVDRGSVVGHYWLPRLLDAAAARAALARWMAGNDTVKNLDEKSRVGELAPISFPMWMFRSRAGKRVWVEPAAPTPIPQLADLDVPAGRLAAEPAEAGEVEEVEARIPLETARGWLAEREVGELAETALVRVPLWRARYTYEGREYVALVEASTGTVLASVFPEKAESPYALVAVVGLGLFTLLGFAISDPVAKLLAFAVAAVPLWLLAFWVARKV